MKVAWAYERPRKPVFLTTDQLNHIGRGILVMESMTVIFVHGAAMDGRTWQRHLAVIDGPGVAVTLSHSGATPDRSRPLALATHAEDADSA
jgi:pimeloyl-ACP methyl ester carboxylesterase